jgi:hypothetical protein
MADTVSTMEIIDEVRRQIGIVFPGEQTACPRLPLADAPKGR